MHRELRDRLPNAAGVSDLVVVVFLDVRGFSSFARMAESSEAALFLRSMYTQVLDNYFPDAAFFKPTGDGLMIIRHYDEKTLESVVFDSISQGLQLTKDFAGLCSDDPMVNFDVPTELGVGIARGAATGLVSDGYTLDYSGRPLNLASRLMDLARPTGVVYDTNLTKGLTTPADLGADFIEEQVYVKGIAELSALTIYRSKAVSIPAANRRPLVGVPFEEALDSMTFKQLAQMGRFIHRPTQEPIDPDSVALDYWYPSTDGRGNRVEGMSRRGTLEPVEVRRAASGWEVIFDYSQAAKVMRAARVKTTWRVSRGLRYTVAGNGAS